MIDFNIPPVVGQELEYIKQAINNKKICGDGEFTKQCNEWIEKNFKAEKSLLTTSCTHSLEMAAILSDVKSGDEVIMPSYTFVSTANAFVMRGAKIKFVDIHPNTMNLNENLIEAAITNKTKAIVPVHYAGVACNMDAIMNISNHYGIDVIEDAAQGVMSKYKGDFLGTIGTYGCYSFHETKNYSMGEGGALLVNKYSQSERAEIIREKGTNRSKFFRGQVDKYTWVDVGSSYLPSELNAAYLLGQLESADLINDNRLNSWDLYHAGLSELEKREYIKLPEIPEECTHNAHMFYVKTKNVEERTQLIEYLKLRGVQAVFHYVPLHSSPYGQVAGEFVGKDNYTTKESERILRLPLYYGIKEENVAYVIDSINMFYKNI